MSSRAGGFANAWLQAMDEATRCLHEQQQQQQQRIAGNNNDDMLEDTLGDSILRLEVLQGILYRIPPSAWQLEPSEPPPARNAGFAVSNTGRYDMNGRSYQPFGYGYDDDDDDDVDEAGDQPTLFHASYETMNVLRILIRIGTYIADLYARRGSLLAQQSRAWTEGAQALLVSLHQMRTSLELADDQISKYFQQEEVAENCNPQARNRKHDLQEDADIVHVATQSLFFQRDKYVSAAKRQSGKLQRILQPQWQDRDQIKNQWGKERWENNPRPKNDYSKLREEAERELHQLQAAIQSLQVIDELQDSAQALKSRLSSNGGSAKGKRYNGLRPPFSANRVPDLPDPAEYGWKFTGSDQHVEFYEKIFAFDDADGQPTLVKLDFYFTTGTIKTSMDHPTKGKTQLFASGKNDQVTPELFVKILLNPRSHTNVRYGKKNNNNNKSRNGRKKAQQASATNVQ